MRRIQIIIVLIPLRAWKEFIMTSMIYAHRGSMIEVHISLWGEGEPAS